MERYYGWEPFQHTLGGKIRMAGIGLHSGQPVNMTIRPAHPSSGIVFWRKDKQMAIPALMDRVVDTTLATTIGEQGAVISTTEHLLAALAGLGVDNAQIELEGAELPIMDGSAWPFVHLLRKIGLRRQKSFKKIIKITDEITIQDGDRSIRILPYEGFRITCEIDFDHAAISKQCYSAEITTDRFITEISRARTFGFLEEVEHLQQNGKALGGSLANAVVVDRLGILNAEGLRFEDEFVRHKVLDLIGDFSLLGFPLMGHVIASRPGHQLHLKAMQEIARRPECWQLVRLHRAGEAGILERSIRPFFLPVSALAGHQSCSA